MANETYPGKPAYLSRVVFRVIPERPPTVAEIGLPGHLSEIGDYHQGLVIVCGPSGSGKSTLLNLLGGLDTVSSGRVELAGRDLASMREVERARWRNRHLGFVYQFHHLLPEFTALENVAMPLLVRGTPAAVAQTSARELLEQVGLGQRTTHKPAQLSGGERQRTAIARALVARPAAVLADEPTGNLDSKTGKEILQLFRELNTEKRITMLLVTHDAEVARRAGNRAAREYLETLDDAAFDRQLRG